MGIIIRDGRGNVSGTNFIVGVSEDNFMLTAGSITSIPAVTATNESISEVLSPHTGSATLVAGAFNGSTAPLLMNNGSDLLVQILGSVQVYGPTGSIHTIGSTEVYNTNPQQVFNSGLGFLTVGCITSLPSITTSSDSVIALGSQSLGSATLVAGITDPNPGSVYPLRMYVGSALMIGGSVSTFSPVGIGSVRIANGETGSVHNIGSIQVFGNVIGSIVISGTVPIDGTITATNESVAKPGTAGLGSMTIMAGFSGGVAMPLRTTLGSDLVVVVDNAPTGSFHNIGSIEVFQQTATNLEVNATQVTDPWTVDGTVNLGTAYTGVGSVVTSGVSTITGSVTIHNAETGSQHNIGSIEVYGPIGSLHTIGSTQIYGELPTGSVHNIGSIEVYGQATVGSVHNIGSIGVFGLTGSLHTIGSNQVYGQNTLGSVHNIGSIEVFGTTGSLHNIGSIETFGIGSVRISAVASDIVDPLQVEQNRGIFKFSGATITGSTIGSYLQFPGTGSKLLIKGFNASCEVATQFRIIFSGLVPEDDGALVSTFSVPNSGTVAMNFMGMEPSGPADARIGIGLFNAGSVHISFFTEDTL